MPQDQSSDVIPVLNALGFQLRRALSSSSAPPFLGLALPMGRLDRAREVLPQATAPGLDGLLRKHGTVVAWAICASLAEEYGDKGGKVWPIVAKLLGRREIVLSEREVIGQAFSRVCRKDGLPIGGLARTVDAFLLHAGPARRQLVHLATAFLTHERIYGPPPADDTVALNRWEDDALEHLGPGLSVLPRCIIMDASAYMGTAFIEWRQKKPVETEYLAEFYEALEKSEKRSGGTGNATPPARPSLTWDDGRPHLDIPDLTGSGGRVNIRIDGRELRLRPGARPLPLPAGKQLEWDENGATRTMSLYEGYRGPAALVAFDADTRRRVSIDGAESKLRVSTPAPILSACVPFAVNDELVPVIGPDLYGCEVDLRGGAARIKIGDIDFLLSGTRRTRIVVSGHPIARGATRLWGGDAEIEVDRGQYSDTGQSLSLALQLTDCDGTMQGFVTLTEDACNECIPIVELLARAGLPQDGHPCRLRLTLLRDGGDGAVETRFYRTLDVWPGFTGRRDRLIDSVRPPKNFHLDESAHIDRDDGGRLVLEAGSGFTEARMVFEVAGRLRSYALRPLGTTAVMEYADGRRAPWPLGNTLVIGTEGTNGALVIRSTLSDADLQVGRRLVERPFATSGTWAVPLPTLRGDGDIALILPEALPLRIAAVECASEPVRFVARTWSGGAELLLAMRERIDAVRVVRTSENGREDLAEIRFDHRPCEVPNVYWAEAQIDGRGAIVIRLGSDDAGLSRFDFSVKIQDRDGEARWSRLSNGRGDQYVVAVARPEDGEARPSALRRIDSWMQDCYAAPSWYDARLGETLTARWRTLLGRVMRAPGGDSFLLSLVHGNIEAETSTWLPMRHPVEVVAALHAAPSHAFTVLSGAENEAGRAMRRLAFLKDAVLRDAEWIDPTALLAFSNLREAQFGARLEGFSSEKLAGTLRKDPDQLRRSGRRWDGAVVLGFEHASAAIRRLGERLEDYRLLEHSLEDSPMSERSLKLHHLCRTFTDAGRSYALSAPEEEGSISMIDRLLAAYARAARSGTMTEILHQIHGSAGLPTLGEAIRLGPELLAFHLLSAELEATR